jgi:hypothetical protein
MPGNFGTAGPIDFSALGQIGQQFGGIIKDRRLSNALSGLGPDASLEDIAAKLMEIDPALGVKTMIEARQADSLAGYRSGQIANSATNAVPDDVKEMEWAIKNGYVKPPVQAPKPMQLGPSESSGGTNLFGQPAIIQKKFMSLEDQAKANEMGKAGGEREAREESRKRLSGNVEGSLRDILTQVQGMDDASFENALGPFQGQTALPGASKTEEARNFLAQQVGAIANATRWGGKENTAEVRNIVKGGQAAIAAAIKPLVRSPGEGVFSDKDQALLDNIVGDLTTVKDKAEFYRRLKGVKSRIKKSLGLDIELPELDAIFQQGAAGKVIQDRAPMDMATDPPVQGNMGGPRQVPTVSIDPATGEETPTRDNFGAPQPKPEHVSKLKELLAQYPDPKDQAEIMDEWERKYPQYGRGAADHFLGRDVQAGR